METPKSKEENFLKSEEIYADKPLQINEGYTD
jgi:hypothetical protein